MWQACICLLAVITVAGACTNSDEESQTSSSTTQPSEELETGAPESDQDPASTVDQLPKKTIYTADFESAVGSEWSATSTFTIGDEDRSVLGRFTNEEVELRLSELPPHQVITVAIDLYVIGSWGQPRSNRWQMLVDQNRVISTTFSNYSDSEQAYPANTPLGVSPGRSEAGESGVFADAVGSGADGVGSIYRIERTFLHTGNELTLAMSGRELDDVDLQSWAIDNVEVSVSDRPDGSPSTNIVFEVADGRIAVTGQVPTSADEELLETALELSFGNGVDAVELTTTQAPPPLWLYSIGELMGHMMAYRNHTLVIDETSATAQGTVRTERWQSSYAGQLASIIGPSMETDVTLDVELDAELVAEVETMRLLFTSGSADLTGEHRLMLDRLVELLEANPLLVVRIDGHTDTIGERGENRDLSLERAEATLEYATSQGADPERLDIRAAGEVDPETDEADSSDRAANRRVSFVVPEG